MTKDEQRALIDTVEPLDLDAAVSVAKQIIDATGDLPQSYFMHLALMQRDIAGAMRTLIALRPDDTVAYDQSLYP